MGRGVKITLKGEMAVKYLIRFKDTPIRSLAKKLYTENSKLYRDVDDARGVLKHHAGLDGAKRRKSLKNPEALRPVKTPQELAQKHNPLRLPESFEDNWTPYVMPSLTRRLLILSDIHLPYHNIEALELAIQYGIEMGADSVLLNGDTLDCYSLSKYEKDPRKRGFSDELESGRQLLAYLRQEFDGCPIYFKMGNHEERYERYLSFKAPELLDCSEFKLDMLLRFGEYGVQLITDKRIIKAGKLSIMHGHEFFGGGAGVNPARGYFMRSKESVLCGHNHQTSEHTEPTLSGDIITAWSTGCLSELHPMYMPVNKWNLGFAFVEIETDGTFKVHNKRIFKGKVL